MSLIMAWVTVLLCLSDSVFWRRAAGRESQFGSFVTRRLPVVDALVKPSSSEKPWSADLKRRQEPNYEEDGSTNMKPSETTSP
jgi:hypothetical protein